MSNGHRANAWNGAVAGHVHGVDLAAIQSPRGADSARLVTDVLIRIPAGHGLVCRAGPVHQILGRRDLVGVEIDQAYVAIPRDADLPGLVLCEPESGAVVLPGGTGTAVDVDAVAGREESNASRVERLYNEARSAPTGGLRDLQAPFMGLQSEMLLQASA